MFCKVARDSLRARLQVQIRLVSTASCGVVAKYSKYSNRSTRHLTRLASCWWYKVQNCTDQYVSRFQILIINSYSYLLVFISVTICIWYPLNGYTIMKHSSEITQSSNSASDAPNVSAVLDSIDSTNEAFDRTNQSLPVRTHLPSNVTISAGTPIVNAGVPIVSGSQSIPFQDHSFPVHTTFPSNSALPFLSYPGVLIHPSMMAVPSAQLNQVSSSPHGVIQMPYNIHIMGVIPRYPMPQDFRYPVVSNTTSSSTVPISLYAAPTQQSSSTVSEKDASSRSSNDDTANPSKYPSDPPKNREGDTVPTLPANFQGVPPLRLEKNSVVLPVPSFWNQQSLIAHQQDPKFAKYGAVLHTANTLDQGIRTSATFAMGVPVHTEPSACSSPKSRRRRGGVGSEVDSSIQGSQSDSLPNAHHFLMPASDALKLISSLTWEEKIVYVARHLLGGRTVNGFLQATSMAQRYKKRRARQLTRHAINGKKTQIDFDELEKLLSEESHDNATSDARISDETTEEVLKKITMNEYMARRLAAEMAFGITYCDTVSSVIESILEEMSPFKRCPTEINTALDPFINKEKNSSSPTRVKKAKVVSTSTEPFRGNVDTNPSLQSSKSVMDSNTPTEASTSSIAGSMDGHPGSSLFSTLRSLRAKNRKKTTLPPPVEIQSVINISNRKEKMTRMFDMIRFRPLKVGDFVAVRPTSQDVWILSRVVLEWKLPSSISREELMDMPIVSYWDVNFLTHTIV